MCIISCVDREQRKLMQRSAARGRFDTVSCSDEIYPQSSWFPWGLAMSNSLFGSILSDDEYTFKKDGHEHEWGNNITHNSVGHTISEEQNKWPTIDDCRAAMVSFTEQRMHSFSIISEIEIRRLIMLWIRATEENTDSGKEGKKETCSNNKNYSFSVFENQKVNGYFSVDCFF